MLRLIKIKLKHKIKNSFCSRKIQCERAKVSANLCTQTCAQTNTNLNYFYTKKSDILK